MLAEYNRIHDAEVSVSIKLNKSTSSDVSLAESYQLNWIQSGLAGKHLYVGGLLRKIKLLIDFWK